MKQACLALVLLGSLTLCPSVRATRIAPIAGSTLLRPFPQHVSYAPGTIRPNHRSQAQQDDDVRAYYEVWKANFLVSAGTSADGQPLYRVTLGRTDPAYTVSEGQGYGLMIMALMAGHDPDAQTLFDGLWRYARNYPSVIDSRLMSWHVPPRSQPGDDVSAFDGDSDIAYGLLLADAQWGTGGTINYRAEAQTVIAGILASTIGPDSRLPMLGDWIQPHGDVFNQYTPRSSDFMPAHFRSFGIATANPVWSRVVLESQAVITSLQTNYSPNTGLLPDFIVPTSTTDRTPKPAPPHFLEKAEDGDYGYNAGRVPWRLGVDGLLNGDPVSLAQARKISRWAFMTTGGDPFQLRAGYALDGRPLPNWDYFSIFFAAPFGVAAMTDPAQQEWLNDLYDSVYATHDDYYEDSVALLSLLVMTGNTWSPETPLRRRRPVRR